MLDKPILNWIENLIVYNYEALNPFKYQLQDQTILHNSDHRQLIILRASEPTSVWWYIRYQI